MKPCKEADRRRPPRTTRALIAICAALVLTAVAAPQASAQVRLVPFGDRTYATPRHLAGDPGDADRVFVVEAGGTIKLVEGGVTRPTDFLDISAEVCAPAEGCGGESGMFSVAFAPDYASSGLFYVFFTRDVAAETHELVIKEFRATDPNDADESSGRDVLVIPHPVNQNHNGGQLQFGPDGFLYIGTGDGGGSNDPRNNAQNLGSLLGKLLRIHPPDPPGAATYSVPTDNPFAGATPGADEIYAYGLRNPYRFSFDRATGDLTIGDVGQGAWEEIDFMPAGTAKGANFGWDCFEGTALATSATKVPPDPQCAPPPADHTPPVLEYARPPGGAAVNGGVVVRDQTVPALLGRYVYADSAGALPGNAIFSAVLFPGGHSGNGPTGLSAPFVVSFGEDACARVYVVSGGGQISRIQSGTGSPGCSPQTAPPPPARASDTQPPGLELEVLKGRRAARSGEIRIRATCAEACSLRVMAEFRLPGRNFEIGPEGARLAAGAPQELVMPLSRRQTRRLRGALRRGKKAKAVVEALAADAAGNEHTVRQGVRQRR